MNKEKIIQNLTLGKNKFYKMQIEDDAADVYIYDEISWLGITANQFVKDLNDIKAKTIRLHLNTPGGNIFDGVAIYNALKNHPAKVEAYIEGLAASIGSIIALAGDTVSMSDNAFFMIHDPWVLAIGGAVDLRKTADDLDKIKGVLVETYAKKTGHEQKQIEKWMADETWFTAQEAKDAGFIDKITGESEEAKDKFNLTIFDNVPNVLLCQKKEEKKPSLSLMEMKLALHECE